MAFTQFEINMAIREIAYENGHRGETTWSYSITGDNFIVKSSDHVRPFIGRYVEQRISHKVVAAQIDARRARILTYGFDYGQCGTIAPDEYYTPDGPSASSWEDDKTVEIKIPTCEYAQGKKTGIAVSPVKYPAGPMSLRGHPEYDFVAQRENALETASLTSAIREFKRTTREWPTCKLGGEIRADVNSCELVMVCCQCEKVLA